MSLSIRLAATREPAAPVPIVWPGSAHGWIRSAAWLAALVSMFRYPLRHFWRRWREKGKEAER